VNSSAFALFGFVVAAGFGQQPVTLIHISDTHISDFAGAHPKLREWRDRHGETNARLQSFLSQTISDQKAAFVVASGDLIDAWCLDGPPGAPPIHGQVELFRSLVARSPVPFYPALGNHDIECYRYRAGATAATGDQSVKAQTRETWGRNLDVFRHGTYYSFRQQVGSTGYRFLMLDNGESGSMDPEYRRQQMAWVRREAEGAPQDYLIFVMHIPLGRGLFTEALGDAAAGTRAVLALAGHNHRDVLDIVPFGAVSLPQVRTAALESGASHWRAIRLFADRIEITETGDSAKTLLTIGLRK
jgi:3',5'-cyclic AMP phosphodiesterase CpdA